MPPPVALSPPAPPRRKEYAMSFQPEIVKGDPLYEAIVRVVVEEDPRHVLEIGSANGLGSTQAFIEGAAKLKAEGVPLPTIYCLEAHPKRFNELVMNTGKYEPIERYNYCSVPVKEYLTESDIDGFYETHGHGLNIIRHHSRDTVKGWLREELEMIRKANIEEDGIEAIKQCRDIYAFDIVLIDGSAFTGAAEFDRVHGAKWIILDDVADIKCFDVHAWLLASEEYRCVEVDLDYRNGYAVWEKVG